MLKEFPYGYKNWLLLACLATVAKPLTFTSYIVCIGSLHVSVPILVICVETTERSPEAPTQPRHARNQQTVQRHHNDTYKLVHQKVSFPPRYFTVRGDMRA